MISRIYRESLGLLTDVYQLTMIYGYWKKGINNKEACFDLFFRENPFQGSYAVSCGLEYVIDYLKNVKFTSEDIKYLKNLKTDNGKYLFDDKFLQFLKQFKFKCNIDAIEEGRLVFPHEPLIRITGPLYQCQLLETPLLNMINFQTLIATKASRMYLVAGDDPILEFGLRRAQGFDGALAASRAAFIGGCSKTSNLLAGKLFGIPVSGTHSHSWVLSFDSEEEAFRSYSEVMPDNCILLVDTYDTIKGVKNAIRIAKELKKKGKKLIGIRIDSGDLAYLSNKARQLLDLENLQEVQIFASNALDEHVLTTLKNQKSKISFWGIGTKLVTAYDQPSLEAVYKLSAIKDTNGHWVKKLKLSEQKNKINNPGVLQVRRFRKDDRFYGDMIYEINSDSDNTIMVDPNDQTKSKTFSYDIFDHEDLLKPIFSNGQCVYNAPSIFDMKSNLLKELTFLDNSIKRLYNPHIYPVGLEQSLYETKTSMILELRSK